MLVTVSQPVSVPSLLKPSNTDRGPELETPDGSAPLGTPVGAEAVEEAGVATVVDAALAEGALNLCTPFVVLISLTPPEISHRRR